MGTRTNRGDRYAATELVYRVKSEILTAGKNRNHRNATDNQLFYSLKLSLPSSRAESRLNRLCRNSLWFIRLSSAEL